MKHFYAICIFVAVVCFTYLVVDNANAQGTVNLDQGLVAYFPFEGNADDVKGGLIGSERGEVTYAQGPVGLAAMFDGNGFIEVAGIAGSEAWALSFWAVVNENPTTEWYALVGTEADKFEGTGGKYNYGFYWYPQGWSDIQYETCDDAGDEDHMLNPGQPLNLKVWYHVVASLDSAGNYKYYLNGKLVGQKVVVDKSCAVGTALIIGGQTTSLAHLFKGGIDELRIYGRGVSDAEALALAASTEKFQPCPKQEPVVVEVEKIVYVDRPVEVIKTVTVQVPVEKIVYVDRPVEVIKTVTVQVPVEKIVYVDRPVEVIKTVEVIKEVIVEKIVYIESDKDKTGKASKRDDKAEGWYRKIHGANSGGLKFFKQGQPENNSEWDFVSREKPKK